MLRLFFNNNESIVGLIYLLLVFNYKLITKYHLSGHPMSFSELSREDKRKAYCQYLLSRKIKNIHERELVFIGQIRNSKVITDKQRSLLWSIVQRRMVNTDHNYIIFEYDKLIKAANRIAARL